jgi:molecular chaperone GrpE
MAQETRDTEQQAQAAQDQNATDQASGAQAEQAAATEDAGDGAGQISQEEDEAAGLAEQLKESQDKYLRLMAEFDNFKRRTAKDFEKMVESAADRIMQDMIDIRENFVRAIDSQATSKDYDKFFEGMKLIFVKFSETLTKYGLEEFAAVGEPFDPQLHDAMMQMPHPEIAANHLVQVYEKGYRIKGRVIRHAKVIVSSGAPAADAQASQSA